MASTEPPGDPGGEVKPSPGKAGKLEGLPKEDLIKYIKKQAAISQKVKAKCEDLSKQILTLKKQAAETTDNDRVVKLEEEVTSLKEEREEMLTAYNAVQQQQLASAEIQQKMEQNLSNIEDENNNLKKELMEAKSSTQNLAEQFECLKMKEETTRSSFQSVQEDNSCLATTNESLKEQVNVLTEARDVTMNALKVMKQERESREMR
ncbi:putative GRIP and coiled-coil domain-containing protein 2-like [Apostichopus japonicus]|uniref:Putative GRIP and coiled-coil domain-containing protein 2-like n=1 Tax=Stichopus japonicus TaxID=307972 RepID=A0A2G8JTI2_STIJA|nr:putative GRIP and coiled-coil domain-containing protein 2-like [Apostichopus japonicus]